MVETIRVQGFRIEVHRRTKLPVPAKKINYEEWKEFLDLIKGIEIQDGEEATDWFVFKFFNMTQRDIGLNLARRFHTDFRKTLQPGSVIRVWSYPAIGYATIWIRLEKERNWDEPRIPLR